MAVHGSNSVVSLGPQCSKTIHSNKISSSYRLINTKTLKKSIISMPNNLFNESSTNSIISSATSTITFSETNCLEDWIYWQRDLKNIYACTKVYAVLENELLWLYSSDLSSRSTLLIQIAVASVEVSGDNMLRLMDPNDEIMEISLYDPYSFYIWRERLQQAAEMTAKYFQVFAINAKTLPRGSVYRGSLVAYRRATKRTKCKAFIQWIVTTCKKKILTSASASIKI
jgi:hypothetical protein